jgi:hypothetical protein
MIVAFLILWYVVGAVLTLSALVLQDPRITRGDVAFAIFAAFMGPICVVGLLMVISDHKRSRSFWDKVVWQRSASRRGDV